MARGDTRYREPVRLLSDLASLDQAEVGAGYKAGLAGWDCPCGASRAWWHGWRMGMMGTGRMYVDEHAYCLHMQVQRHGIQCLAFFNTEAHENVPLCN